MNIDGLEFGDSGVKELGDADIADDPFLRELEITDADIQIKGERLKRRCYSGTFKLEVVNYAEEKGNCTAAKMFNLNESTIRGWIKKKEKLEAMDDTKKFRLGNTCRLRDGQWPELEEKLEALLLEKKAGGIELRNESIQGLALELGKQLGIDSFTASKTWLRNFKHRIGLLPIDPE